MSLAVLILAAGQSKRMKSLTPKIFHDLGGCFVIEHVYQTVQGLFPHQVVFVIAKEYKDHPFFQNKQCVVQDPPLGTGDAIKQGMKAIDQSITEILIVYGDAPLICQETLKKLLPYHFGLVGMDLNDQLHLPYGRLVLSQTQHIDLIVEYKDATEHERTIPYANSGVYKIQRDLLDDLLPLLTNDNQQKEFYATDLIKLARDKNIPTNCIFAPFELFQGINDRIDLAQAYQTLQQRFRQKFLKNGVTLLSPEITFFSFDTQIAQDCRIDPFVTIGPKVILESGAWIKSHSVLENAHVCAGAIVGPFAHLRGGVTLYPKAQVGNFVEIKASSLEEGVKVKHLSYIGDTAIGKKTNIGAGTITCNYNGYVKSKTKIGSKVLIGAHSTIIAPVEIGDESIIAAGTVVDQLVPAESLAISRSKQTIKPLWAKKFHERYNQRLK